MLNFLNEQKRAQTETDASNMGSKYPFYFHFVNTKPSILEYYAV